MKKLLKIYFYRFVLAMTGWLLLLGILFWPRTCQNNVYFRGVRDCPSTAEINNHSFISAEMIDKSGKKYIF